MMASTAPTNLGRRLRLAVAGPAVLTALTVATAAAVVPPVPAAAPPTSRPGPGSTAGPTSPRSPFPGFVLERGRYTTIEAADPGVLQYPFDVNDRGQITGEYVRVGPDGIPDSESGFVRDARGRVIGTFSTDTPIVNDSASPHGYLWDRGKVTRIDVPAAVATGASGVNDRAQIVGSTANDLNLTGARGFVLAKGIKGPFTPISVPGGPRTVANGLNNRGHVVGIYENPNATPSPRPDRMPPMSRMS